MVRWALRVLHRLDRWRGARRGNRPGAAVAVLRDGRVLVVRHSYRPGLDLPGGERGRGESAEHAAVRELEEETGLRADPAALRPVYATPWLRVFEWDAGPADEVRIDRREVTRADWRAPEAIERDRAASALDAWLTCRIPPGTPPRP